MAVFAVAAIVAESALPWKPVAVMPPEPSRLTTVPAVAATAVFAPLIFKLAERTQAFAAGFLEPARVASGTVRGGRDSAPAARDDVDAQGGGAA